MPSKTGKHGSLIILGIDPGYDRLGIAVLEKPEKTKEVLLHSQCFKTNPKDVIYDRLLSVGQEVSKIIDEYKPDALAIENLFITKNQKTGMRVAEARGIIIYEALKRNIEVFEYSPMEIKSAVTGDGASDKQRVIKMVGLLVNMPKKTIIDDEYDAVAIALTHSSRCR